MMQVADGRAVARRAWFRGLRPEPSLSVSEWADRFRFLSSKSSAEPGQYRTSRTPFLREIMDDLSTSSPVQTVVVQKGAQVGFTEGPGNNWLGYLIDLAPGPIMQVQPTVDLAKMHSKHRVQTMLEDCPRLAGKIKDKRERDAGNTMLAKEFAGGMLRLVGANSPTGLRSMPVKYLSLDEVDAYPSSAGEEGDPVGLALARTRTFARKKVLLGSTPTIRGRSRIEKAYLETDQRKYFVPCPDCGEFQVLVWRQVQWDEGEPENAYYVCEHCGVVIHEGQKTAMLAAGEWRVTKPENLDPLTKGYHLSALYSPVGWYSWGEAAVDFVKAKESPLELRVWVNTVLGETWEDKGDAPPWEELHKRREDYPTGVAPKGALLVTAGADVQQDRIEVELVAWGRGRESWSIGFHVFPGDPRTSTEPWEQLRKLREAPVPVEGGGELPVRMLAVDSGAYTQTVYDWCRRQPSDRVMATKGKASLPVLVGQPRPVEVKLKSGRKLRRGIKLWFIGTDMAKSELYGWLRHPVPTDPAKTGWPPGFCHFPDAYAEEYFKQLTAERLVMRMDRRGYRKYQWEATRERNEALDCRILARAGAYVLGIDRWTDSQWNDLQDEVHGSGTGRRKKATATKVGRQRRPRGEHFKRWRGQRAT